MNHITAITQTGNKQVSTTTKKENRMKTLQQVLETITQRIGDNYYIVIAPPAQTKEVKGRVLWNNKKNVPKLIIINRNYTSEIMIRKVLAHETSHLILDSSKHNKEFRKLYKELRDDFLG